MNAETVKSYLNIADLDQSARMLSLLNEIYFLQLQVNALVELTKINLIHMILNVHFKQKRVNLKT